MSLLRLSRPFHLLLAALTYLLGAGMARYLGNPFNAAAFWLGAFWGLSLHVAATLLTEYFRNPVEPLADAATPRQRERLRIRLLQVAAAFLVLSAAFTITLLYAQVLTLSAILLMGLIFALLMAYAIPPVRLVNTGFGEIALAVLLAGFLPALAFLLQSDEFHRLLPLVTFPLTFLALAYLLVCAFPSFAADQKYARRTLLIRLTWQRAVLLHHLFVLAAYLLFAAALFFGLPFQLIWPVFLTLPFAVLQIFWLNRIASGGKPLWTLLTANAAAVFSLTAYVLALTFWIR